MLPQESLKFDRIDKRFTRLEVFSAAIYAVIVVWINAYICRGLFTSQTAYMNSMHGFWAALSKHAADGLLRSNWWPFWDCGIPFEFTYAPLVPGLTLAFSAMRSITPELAFQCVSGVVYCLAPLTLFLMAWLLTRAPGHSFLAALFYSLTSPTELIAPAADYSFRHFWDAHRLYLITVWDDTPHLAAASLLPLSILFLALSMQKRRAAYVMSAVVVATIMALASDFGPVEVTMSALCLISVFPRRDYGRNMALVIAIGALAYAIVAPFLPPSLILAIIQATSTSGGGWSVESLTALAIVAIGWIVLFRSLERWTGDWRLRFFALFAYLTSSVPLVAISIHRQFLPQPRRYTLEMELAIPLIVIFGLRPVFQRAPGALKLGLLFLFLSLAAEQIVGYRQFAKKNIRPADLTQTVEYRAAAWSSENLPGVRIMFPGSVASWVNDFRDIEQFAGSSWSLAYNQVQQRGLEAIYNGGDTPEQDARVSLAWLRAFGVGAIAVSGPNSAEFWKPFTHPDKFQDLLPVLWRDSGVTIYKVPRRTGSLAHVVSETAVVTRPPASPRDTGDVEKYAAALEDVSLPPAVLEWMGRNRIQVRTTASPGQAISVQVSYHPGWHATMGGREIEVRRDGLGLMWLRPECSGPCETWLDYDGGWELRVCRYLSLATISVLLILALRRLALGIGRANSGSRRA